MGSVVLKTEPPLEEAGPRPGSGADEPECVAGAGRRQWFGLTPIRRVGKDRGMTSTSTRAHAFSDDALADHDAVGLAALLRAREVGVAEVVEAAVSRARQVQPSVFPVELEAYDDARREATRLDREGLGDEAFAG